MSTPTSYTLEPLAEMVYGQSAAMQALNAVVADIARTDIPVLLQGESGTGKEVYARLIHRLSGVGQGPLRRLSCATLEPGRLLRQIQEGMQPGNGAVGAGTLLLDGVEELDPACQRLLLSLLPDSAGKNGESEVTARVISTTSRNLEEEIEKGRFRRELYFRINGVRLRLPPVRERKEDIPALVQHFLAKYSSELKRDTPVLNQEALELLSAHDWPGNIREIENVAKKVVALGDAGVALGDLRTAPRKPGKANDGAHMFSLKVASREASRRAERELILQALERTHWNRKRAAQELQISYKSLLYKIKLIGVQGATSDE
jgi:two-component system response regulator AtoC